MKLFFLMFIFSLSVEVALEIRHYLKGYDTVFFPKNDQDDSVGLSSGSKKKQYFGPTKSFPFRSVIFPVESFRGGRIWIASASHAEHIYLPPTKIFPNLICGFIDDFECVVINGSKAGIDISGDLTILKAYHEEIKPDYIVLYQMSQAIERMQGEIVAGEAGSIGGNNNSIFDMSFLNSKFEQMSSYQHLVDYIGGNIKLSGMLKSRLPKAKLNEFAKDVNEFILWCRTNGYKPILSTFAASHDASNIHTMAQSIKTSFVRYNSYLSPLGWANSVSDLNGVIREIAAREGVLLIDVAYEMNGRPEFFVDFVHFNETGHELVARYIADSLSDVIGR